MSCDLNVTFLSPLSSSHVFLFLFLSINFSSLLLYHTLFFPFACPFLPLSVCLSLSLSLFLSVSLSAADLFHQLSQALEVLTDAAARVSFQSTILFDLFCLP